MLAQAPPAEAITPALIEAAKKEGKVNFYTAMEINIAQQYSKMFEEKFPGISVKVERSGAERVFSRIAQEYASKIHNVDLVNTTDAAHVHAWKRDGLLAPYVPADVASSFAPQFKDTDGTWATVRILFVAMAYNTQLVKPEDAPKGFVDLLDPKWASKIVKAHPSYSGAIMTSTFAIARDLGWGYFEKLAKQKIMQVQSAVDPPKKVALGERAVMADGADYIVVLEKAKGAPIELIYPVEGAPIINSPNCIFKAAPNPNAARLFQNWFCTAGGPAEACRHHVPVRSACAGQSQARPTAAEGHQDHARRPGGAAESRRRDQGQVHCDLQGMTRRRAAGSASRTKKKLRKSLK